MSLRLFTRGTSSNAVEATPKRRPFRRWIAGTAAGAMIASALVTVGVGANMAAADAPAPDVSASTTDTYIAGEDIDVTLTFESAGEAAGDQFNLSAGVVLSDQVTVLDNGSLGAPRVFPAGTVVPGAYQRIDGDCAVLGLEEADPMPAAPNNHACQVPEGKQYLVFQNISDLPEGASATHTLTLRPNADTFPVGSDLELQVTAYTSDDERFIPVFPGSQSVAGGNGHTSEPGGSTLSEPVKALRIEKSEPSPESELLRGVHDNQTVYTLQIHHTGEGDITNTKVVDYLPAGLEYLGSGQVDHTENANGTQGDVEYPNSGPLNGITEKPTGWIPEESIETVQGSFNEDGEFIESADGAVFTKVTWDLQTLLMMANGGLDQVYPGAAGNAGILEIQYVAGIPLYENTMDFGDGATPSAESLEQGANLDNNRGPSTRHGHPTGDDSAAPPIGLTNHAGVSGIYGAGEDAVETSDSTTHTVEAVDVRVVKSVDTDAFAQGGLARYTLNLATSEYATATVPGPLEQPFKLVDDLADGLCPVFPGGTPVVDWTGTPYEGDNPNPAGTPNLALGDPNGPANQFHRFQTIDAWNTALEDAGVSTDCWWDADRSADPANALEGASLAGIGFDPVSGHFFLNFALNPADALSNNATRTDFDISYSVRQNESYIGHEGAQGATTSGDLVENNVEIYALTTPVEDVEGVGTPGMSPEEQDRLDGDWNASEDSEATIETNYTDINKQVLPRSVPVPSAATVADVDKDLWVKAGEEPFTAGDEVWWRIHVDPPNGVDVRNPKVTDFLPATVEFENLSENVVVVPSSYDGLGTCVRPDGMSDADWEAEWITKFAPAPSVNGNVLTWNLGSKDCLGAGNTTDRFMPSVDTFDIYIKTTVVGVSEFGEVDLPENLVKYQQNNVNGEIFFLRSSAEIEIGHQTHLLKGIADINGEPDPANPFNSNVDHLEVVQGDEVTFRVDLAAPEYATSEYIVWDALPEGIVAGDVSDFKAYLWDGAANSSVTPVSAVAYDPGATGRPAAADINSDYADRAIIVWTFDDSVVVPGDPEAVADPADASRTGLSLQYTVTIPGTGATYPAGYEDAGEPRAALLSQAYVNTASIVSYGVPRDGQGTTTHRPEDNPISTVEPQDGEIGVPGDGTHDVSDVYLASADIEKVLWETQVGPNEDPLNPPFGGENLDPLNLDDVIVQGELATYRYTVELPANTTVREGVLFDLGNFVGQAGNGTISPNNTFPYVFESAELIAAPAGLTVNEVEDSDPDAHATDFSFRTDTGKLIFPEYYSTGSADRTFTIELVVWTSDVDASNPTALDDRPNIPNDKELRNTAEFAFKDLSGTPDGEQDWVDVTYREPNLEITKTADPNDDVSSSDTITYTLEITNTNRVKSYDNVVVDTVPAGIQVITGPLATAGATFSPNETALQTGLGGTITWSHEQFADLEEIPATATLTYEATIDPETGAGQDYVNTAEVTGYTLPSDLDSEVGDRRGDRKDSDDATITATTAGIEKLVRVYDSGDEFADSASAPIGETVEYQIVVDLHANVNYYNARITDAFSGSGIGAPERVSITGPTDTPSGSVPGDWTYHAGEGVWTVDNAGSPHIQSSSQDRTLTLTYRVKLENDMTSNSLPNDATFQWTSTPGGDVTDPEERGEVEDDAEVTILNPVLQIEKLVDGQDSIERDPNATFDYTLTVSQTDEGNTAAHNITVVDTVPAGVKVTDITPTAASVDAGVADGEGGKITWELAGPLHPQVGDATPKSIELGYEGSFIDSTELSATAYINEVEITEYESFDSDGRTYVPGENGVPPAEDDASVTPLFPYVVPTKTVTVPADGEDYGIAIAGEPFNWTLAIENEGDGTAEDISVTDLLPKNWKYVGNAQISVNGGAPVALTGEPALTPASVTEGDQQEIVWSPETIREAGATPLAPDGNFVITFDATPTEWALGDVGTGIGIHAHTNTVSVTATDTQGNPENADNEYVGEDDEADAYIAEADLLLVKDALGGVIDSGDPATNLYGLETGTWVPGQSAIVADYAQPQWQLTVTNQGPDASVGPYVYEDTQTLPEGVTVGTWSALYYPADGSGAQTPSLTVTGEGTADAPYIFTVGDEHTVLDADGDASIVLTADVTIAAGATASGSELSNIADVRGETYENPDNFGDNEDEAEKPLTAVADLAIVKEFAPVTGDRNAGDPISWSLVVSNDGPSDSVSSAAEPITVTDAVPAEIVNVAQLEGTVLPAGWALDITGNDITLTLTPDAVFPATGVGSTVEFVFSGNIDASVEAGTEILNEATVHPGETPDPDPSNNEDEDETEPITSITSVGADKYRVELVDGEWVPVAAPADVTAGTEISYRLAITNTGTADARGVTLTDVLPSELDYVSWVAQAPADGWTFGQTDQTLTFSNDQNLAPGATASVIVTVMINESATDDIENTVCAAAENSGTDGDDCATDTTGTGKMVDWALEKSHTVPATGAVNAGETVRYLLQVHNNGPSASDGPITVTDVLPAGFTYADNVAATGLGTITDTVVDTTPEGLDRVTWTIAASGVEFPTGQDVVTIAFDALVGDDVVPGIYTNDARVDGVENEPGDDPSNNDDDDEIPVVRTATMSIEKEVLTTAGEWVEVAEHAAGTEVTWRVLITNEGPSAVPVTFTDTPPTGVTITSMAGDGWECEVADLSCEYTANGALHPVGQSEIVMTSDLAPGVQPTDLPGLVNWGEIAWVDDTTEDPSDRDDAAITTVRSADLGIAKTALDSEGNETKTVIAGGSLWYQLDLWNEGPSDAVAPLIVNDTLPEGITFAGLSGDSAASWTAEVDPADSQTVTFTRTPASGIAVGGEAPSIIFEVRVAETVAAGAELDNVASIDEETLEINGDPVDDPDEAPDSDNAVVTAERQIDLGIVKSHDADAVRVGDELPFTLLVTNYGPSEATGITVTDTVPAGLEVVSETGPVLDEAGDPTGWTIDEIVLVDEADPAGGTTVTVSYESPLLTGEQAAPLVITTLVTPAAYDGVVNVASVTGNEPEPDPDPNPNEDEDPVIVPPLVTLVVEKTAVENEFQVGKTGTFKIEVSNLGPTADPGPITVTDTLPAGLTFQSSPDTGVSTSGSTVTWVIEEGLDVGESVTLTLVVNVAQGAYPEVTNTVVIDSPAEKTPESVLEDDETVPVKAADPLVVTGGDAAAMWLLLALLLGLGGGALLLRKRRDTQPMIDA